MKGTSCMRKKRLARLYCSKVVIPKFFSVTAELPTKRTIIWYTARYYSIYAKFKFSDHRPEIDL
jgi:hypothetical protein